jgi:hypothetical protein
MTRTAGPDLNKGCGPVALTRPARQVHLARTPVNGAGPA